MRATQGAPVLSRVRHWARGLPQNNLGHLDRREVMESANGRLPGPMLTGNYLQGVSIANCLVSARKTAQKTHELLADRDSRSTRQRSSIAGQGDGQHKPTRPRARYA